MLVIIIPGWQRLSQSTQDIVTLTKPLSPHSLNFHFRILKARFMSCTFTSWAWCPAHRRCSINQQWMNEQTHHFPNSPLQASSRAKLTTWPHCSLPGPRPHRPGWPWDGASSVPQACGTHKLLSLQLRAEPGL